MSRRMLVICTLFIVLFNICAGLRAEVDGAGNVSIQIFGPDCLPLANHVVEFASPSTNYNSLPTVYTDNTDAAGWVHLSLPPQYYVLEIVAPEIGFGSSGSFEILNDEKKTVTVPPLVAFAKVSGVVPMDDFAPGDYVMQENMFTSLCLWYMPHIQIDESGHFVDNDVFPGDATLDVYSDVVQTMTDIYYYKYSQYYGINAIPGETIRDLVIGKQPIEHRKHPTTSIPESYFDRSGYARRCSIEGRVIDAKDRPLLGVTVYALATFWDGEWQVQRVLRAITAADGRYSIDRVPMGVEGTGVNIKLVAKSPGLATAIYDMGAGGSKSSPVLRKDIILPGKGGSLAVTVFRNGIALPAALVRISSEKGDGMTDPNVPWAASEPEALALRDLLNPTGKADKNGAAVFTNLTPGMWHVVAAQFADPASFEQHDYLWWRGDKSIADGVAIRDGCSASLSMNIFTQPVKFSFKLLPSSNVPLTGTEVDVNDAAAGSNQGYWSQIIADKDGICTEYVNDSGLRRLQGITRNFPLSNSIPDDREPYESGSSVFAISNALKNPPLAVIHAIARHSGSLRVNLLDEDGHAARGAVLISGLNFDAHYELSTGSDGTGTIAGLHTGSYELIAWIYGRDDIVNKSYETDRIGVEWLLDQKTVKVADDTMASATLRPTTIPEPTPLIDIQGLQLSVDWGVEYLGAIAPLMGKVVTSKNRPVWNAEVELFAPDNWEPIRTAFTDVRGNIFEADASISEDKPSNPPPGSPADPTVVALVPGSYGAAIATYYPDKPVHLKLPKSINIAGRIDVDGKTPPPDSKYEVRAEYQGLGKIDSLLSVEATAQADGTFSLSGLTPGNYLVQAARDGIWLSQTIALVASERKKYDPIVFDIPSPGASMLFRVMDQSGNALPNTEVTFDEPSGPLDDEYWPRSFTTDGIGDLRFDGLSAGRHLLKAKGAAISFDVPDYSSQTAPAQVDIQLPEGSKEASK